MPGNTLVALTSATYDTSTPLFGTGALTGAYGSASTGPGGISGPTGLTSVGWTIEFAARVPAVPSGTIALCGYNNQPSYTNAFYIGVTSAGYLTAVVWDSKGATGSNTYTGATSVATGAWLRLALTVTTTACYLFLGSTLVATFTPHSGYNFSSCIPPEISLGNFYGTPNGPATGCEIDEFVIWPTAKYTTTYTPPASAYAGTEGMVALWHLDSSLADSSVSPPASGTNPLILTGSTFDTTNEKFGTAALSGGYGIGNTGLTAEGWTVECWIKASTLPSATVCAMGVNGTGFLGATTAGHIEFQIASSTSPGTIPTITNSTSSFDGSWHHLAGVVQSTGIALYIDGVSVGTASSGAISTVPTTMGVGNYAGALVANWPGEIDEAVIWPSAKYTGNFTPPSSPYAGTEGMTALWHLDSNGNDSSVIPTTNFAPNNSAIFYSPGNWNVASGQATTVYGGAYFRTEFKGSSVTLSFNTSGLSGTYPQIWVDIDGVSTLYSVASTVIPNIPSAYSSWPAHTMEVRVKATSGNVNRWTPASFVGLTNIGVAGANAALSALPVQSKSAWFIGDSSTEGWNTIATAPTSAGSDDVDAKDCTQGWAYLQRNLLGIEVGVIGFAGQAFQGTGQGGVPNFSTTLGSIYSGAARSFANLPSLIYLVMGANDIIYNNFTQAQITSSVVAYIQNLITLAPGVPIVVSNYYYVNNASLPDSLNNTLTAGLHGAVTQLANPLVTFQSVSGSNTDTTFLSADGLHPLGVMNRSAIAPYRANLLRPVLFPPPRSYVFS